MKLSITQPDLSLKDDSSFSDFLNRSNEYPPMYPHTRSVLSKSGRCSILTKSRHQKKMRYRSGQNWFEREVRARPQDFSCSHVTAAIFIASYQTTGISYWVYLLLLTVYSHTRTKLVANRTSSTSVIGNTSQHTTSCLLALSLRIEQEHLLSR